METRTLRIAANLRSFSTEPVDNVTSRKLEVWRNNNLQIDVGIFDGKQNDAGSWQSDLDAIQSVTAKIIPTTKGKVPSADATVAAQVTTTDRDAAATYEQWVAGTHQHISLALDADDMAVAAGDYWLVVYCLTTTGGKITLMAGALTIYADGSGNPDGDPPVGTTWLNMLEADARYYPGQITLQKPYGTAGIYRPGADTDAARGTALLAAQTAASAGDVIEVGPGEYELPASLGKNGVNWWFAPGAKVKATGSVGASVTLPVWNVTGGMSYTVRGHGEFDATESYVFYSDGTGGVSIHGKKAVARGEGRTVFSVESLVDCDFKFDYIESTDYDILVCLSAPEIFITADEIVFGDQLLECGEEAATVVLNFDQATSTSTAHVFQPGSAKIYAKGRRLDAPTAAGIIGNVGNPSAGADGSLWEIAEIHTTAGTMYLQGDVRLKNTKFFAGSGYIIARFGIPTLENVTVETSGTNSIVTDGSPRSVKVVGALSSNKPKHADITITSPDYVYP